MVCVSIVVGLGLLVGLRDRVEFAAVELSLLESEGIRDEAKRLEIERLKELIGVEVIEIDTLELFRARAAASRPSIEGDTLGGADEWMDRSYRLSQYLVNNPQYKYPGMELLTARDWLAVTKSGEIRTEADYRMTLAELRKVVKMKQWRPVFGAWAEYREKHPDQELQDCRDLKPYLEDEICLELLARFSRWQKGDVVPWVRIGEGESAFYEKRPIDDLWFSVRVFSSGGGAALTGIPNRENTESLKKALVDFVSENRRDPVDVEELTPFVEEANALKVLPEMFEALVTVPEV